MYIYICLCKYIRTYVFKIYVPDALRVLRLWVKNKSNNSESNVHYIRHTTKEEEEREVETLVGVVEKTAATLHFTPYRSRSVHFLTGTFFPQFFFPILF